MSPPERLDTVAMRVATTIAYRSDLPTAADRDRQLHEINPGAWHTTHATTPDTCPHCTDEETRP